MKSRFLIMLHLPATCIRAYGPSPFLLLFFEFLFDQEGGDGPQVPQGHIALDRSQKKHRSFPHACRFNPQSEDGNTLGRTWDNPCLVRAVRE